MMALEKITFFTFLAAAALNFKSVADSVRIHEHKIPIESLEMPSTMTYSPLILSQPVQLSVLVGDTVVLPCRVDYLGKHVVIWKRGRTGTLFAGILQVDSDKTFSLINNTFLQIEKIDPEYAGEYICQVNTEPPIELMHTLRVLVSPTIMLDPKDGNVIVKEGDPFMAKCRAEGYPTPVITWRALKGTLPGGMKEKQGDTLSVASASIQHSKIYTCVADNGVGKPVMAEVHVKVFYRPELQVSPVWYHAGEGSTVEFKCTATSEPTPTVFWIRESMQTTLSEDRHVRLVQEYTLTDVTLILKIHSLTLDHLGSYSCFANNTIGKAYRTVEVSGLAEPVKFKSNLTGSNNDSFLLSWSVKSYSPIIEYMLRIRPQKSKDSSSRAPSWNDVMIPATSQQIVIHTEKYSITGLEAGIGYEVVMQARNSFGWNHPSETFTFFTEEAEPLSDAWNKDKTTSNGMTSQSVVVTEPPSHYTDAEEVQYSVDHSSSTACPHSLLTILCLLCLLSFSLISI